MQAELDDLLDESTVVMTPPPAGARRLLVRPAQALGKDDMRRLGLKRTGAIARSFNRADMRYVEFRRRLYEERFEELLTRAGWSPRNRIVMRDGFAIDDSRSLPHLD